MAINDKDPTPEELLTEYQTSIFKNSKYQARARYLSPQVCTRNYRPPEIILVEKDYD